MRGKVTPRQRGFIHDLLRERIVSEETRDRWTKMLRISEDDEEIGMTFDQAQAAIKWLLGRPKDPNVPPKYPRTPNPSRPRYRTPQGMNPSRTPAHVGTNVAQATQPGFTPSKMKIDARPGVFEMPDGRIYAVRQNKAKTGFYALRLREINGQRLTEANTVVEIEFDYEKGAIWDLTEAMRMPLDRAKELTIRYGRCIQCGRRLKAAKSVEQGIGPVCIKGFAGYAP